MTDTPSSDRPARPLRVGLWVALTVAGWHLAFFATGAVTLALASSPAGGVFEGLAEPFHQKLMLASHLRVLAGYAVVALAALALAYPVVRVWTGAGPATRWGVVARTLVVLGALMAHGWLRLVHTQPYFFGPATYDAWYFRALGQWSEEVRERVLFVVFVFLPVVVVVAAAGVYVVVVARWFREGGHAARWTLAAAASSALLLAGWLVAPHFIGPAKGQRDDRLNVVMLSSDEIRTAAMASSAVAGSHPRLASLAAESIVLTNMRSPMATALGEAASVHTGQAPHTHGLQTPFPSRDRVARALATAPQLPALLGAHGYATTVLGDEGAGAFAVTRGLGFAEIEAGETASYPRHLAGAVYPAHFIIPAWLDNQVGRRLLPDLAVLPGCVSLDVVTDRLTRRLEQNAENGTPFFVHGVYSQAPVPPPPPGDQLSAKPTVAGFDEQLGRVLDCLEENGLRNNTILVVLGRSTTDPTADGSSRTGQAVAVPDLAVPVVLHIPGDDFPPGVISQLTRLFDLAPTLLDVLGLPPAPSMEGVSLRPCLQNHAVRLPLAAFGESPGFPDAWPSFQHDPAALRAFQEGVRLDPASGFRVVLRDEAAALRRKTRWVRTAHWQLVFTPAEASADGIDEWRLFDLRTDPDRSRDVKLSNPKVWQTLEVALRRWADEKIESRITDLFPDGEPPAVVLPGT